MSASSLKKEQEKDSYLMQKYEGLPRIVPPDSPVLNNLRPTLGAKLPCHTQKLGDAFPLTLRVEKPSSPVDNDEDELEIDYEPEVLPNNSIIDLSKNKFTLTELLKLPDTEIPFLLENFIPEDSITMLSGTSEVGKTTYYQELSLAIIQGKNEIFSLKLITKYKRVLIINTEDSAKAIKIKLQKQLTGVQLSKEESDRLTVMTLNKGVENEIETFLKTYKVDLVVIDAFGDVYEGDMRSDNITRAFMNQYIEIIRKYGCTVLFVHHIGKGKNSFSPDKDDMLGSAAIHGKARSVLMLTKPYTDPYIKSLKIVKNNYVSEETKRKSLLLKFNPTTLLHEVVVDESVRDEIATQQKQSEKNVSKRRGMIDLLKIEAQRLREEGKTLEAIGKIVDRDKATVHKWLKKPIPPLYNVSEVV